MSGFTLVFLIAIAITAWVAGLKSHDMAKYISYTVAIAMWAIAADAVATLLAPVPTLLVFTAPIVVGALCERNRRRRHSSTRYVT